MDEWRMMKDEGWMKNDEGWMMMMISICWRVLQTNGQTDICDCGVAFATENTLGAGTGGCQGFFWIVFAFFCIFHMYILRLKFGGGPLLILANKILIAKCFVSHYLSNDGFI